MKRTGEIVLASIGVGLNALASLIIGIIIFLTQSGEFVEGFKETFVQQAMKTGVDVGATDAEMVLSVFDRVGWFVFALFLVATILGGIAIYFYVGNKKPFAASLILLITGAVIIFVTFLVGAIPGILYAIVGIMGLIRREPKEPFDDDTLYEYVDEEPEIK